MSDSTSDTKAINWPSWFLDNCVKTADDLAKADPVLLIRNSDSPNAHVSPDDPITESISGRYEIDAAFYEWVLNRIPMGRLGTVDEVARTVLFLASPAASLITGQSIATDGGWTAQ